MAAPDTATFAAVLGDSRPDSVQLRVGVDPLRTVRASLLEFAGPLPTTVPPPFRASANALLSSVRFDRGALATLYAAPPPAGYPAFLYDDPGPGVCTLEAQLERLQDTPAEVIVSDVEEVCGHAPPPTAYLPWLRQPRRMMTRYTFALRDYDRRILSRLYPNMQRRLVREAEHWAALITMSDALVVGDMLARANPRLGRRGDLLIGPTAGHGDERDTSRMLIYPMIGGPGRLATNAGMLQRRRRDLFLAFATPGLVVHDRRRAGAIRTDPALTSLLGPPRAAIVSQLERRPRTTTGLADALSMSPSTISHHLAHLSAAGLVESTRRGRDVIYMLTSRGDGLVRLYATR